MRRWSGPVLPTGQNPRPGTGRCLAAWMLLRLGKVRHTVGWSGLWCGVDHQVGQPSGSCGPPAGHLPLPSASPNRERGRTPSAVAVPVAGGSLTVNQRPVTDGRLLRAPHDP
jgi:hypothetical protein